MKTTNLFTIAGGSITGADHVRVGQPLTTNNQDAYHWKHGRNCSFAVVCDGCSSGAQNEVGANLGSRILCNLVVQLADEILEHNPNFIFRKEFWEKVERFFLNDILMVSRMMGNSVSSTVNEFFLFTVVGVLITPISTYVVYVGDGMYALNGEIFILHPEENNSPTYIGYQLSGTTLSLTNPDALKIKVHNAFDTGDITSLLIGTDGVLDFIACENKTLPGKTEVVGPLSQFWSENKFFVNPDCVRRRLALVALETLSSGRMVPGLLKDDTTLIVMRPKNQTKTPE